MPDEEASRLVFASRVHRALASPSSQLTQPQHTALSRVVELTDLELPPSSTTTPERSFTEPWPNATRGAPRNS